MEICGIVVKPYLDYYGTFQGDPEKVYVVSIVHFCSSNDLALQAARYRVL